MGGPTAANQAAQGGGGYAYGGMGGGRGLATTPSYYASSDKTKALPGQVALAKDAEGREMVAESVRTVGAKTFYRRNNRWVDAEVKAEEEAKAQTIVQFSDAYFTLAKSQGPEYNQYLTFTEPVTVKLQGQVYRIDPPKP